MVSAHIARGGGPRSRRETGTLSQRSPLDGWRWRQQLTGNPRALAGCSIQVLVVGEKRLALTAEMWRHTADTGLLKLEDDATRAVP